MRTFFYRVCPVGLVNCISLCALSAGPVSESSQAQTAEAPLVQAIRQAETSAQAGLAYRKFLRHASRDEILRLMQDHGSGVEVQMAWVAGTDWEEQRVAPGAQRFVGFVEGRTGLRVPLHWEVATTSRVLQTGRLLQQAMERYALKADFVYKAGDDYTYEQPKNQKLSPRLTGPVGTTLSEHDGRVVVAVDKSRVQFPSSLLRDLSKTFPCGDKLTPLIGADRSILTLDDGLGNGFPLLCLETQTGKVLWKAKVWATGIENIPRGFSGFWYNNVFLQVTKTAVAVFGEANGEIYLEMFDFQSGKAKFRFSSNFWEIGEENKPGGKGAGKKCHAPMG